MNGSEPDDWSGVPCPMPDCGVELFVTWQVSEYVSRGQLRQPEAMAPEHGNVVTWKVECVNDHVILTPTMYLPDCESTTGDDCQHDHGEESRQLWPSDWARLAALIERLRPVVQADEAAGNG